MGRKFKFISEKPKEKWRIFDCGGDNGQEKIKGMHIEIIGNREMIVDGCMGVLEYSDTYLKLKLPKGALTVIGSDFDIVSFEGRVISVKGRLSSFEFSV